MTQHPKDPHLGNLHHQTSAKTYVQNFTGQKWREASMFPAVVYMQCISIWLYFYFYAFLNFKGFSTEYFTFKIQEELFLGLKPNK